MIGIDVNICYDTVTLLKNLVNKEVFDLKNEVLSSFYATDYYSEKITEDLSELYDDDFVELLSDSKLDMADYLIVNEDGIEFDYSESREMSDLRCVSFRIDCDFDDNKFVKDLHKELEDKGKEEFEL